MKERTASFGSSYRYGFNNQEKDAEMGEYYAFEYRIHDARIGRFLSVDPDYFKYYYQSTYVFAGNNPELNIDYLGKGSNPSGTHKISSGDCPSSIAQRYGMSLEQLAQYNEGKFANGSFFKPKPTDMTWDTYWKQGGALWQVMLGDVLETSTFDNTNNNLNGNTGSFLSEQQKSTRVTKNEWDNPIKNSSSSATDASNSANNANSAQAQITLAKYNTNTDNVDPQVNLPAPSSSSNWSFTFNVTAAGGAVVNGSASGTKVGVGWYKGAPIIGLKDNKVYLLGYNFNDKTQEQYKEVSAIAGPVGQSTSERYVKNNNGDYQLYTKDITRSYGVLLFQASTDANGNTVQQGVYFNYSLTIGLGLIGDVGIKIPVYTWK